MSAHRRPVPRAAMPRFPIGLVTATLCIQPMCSDDELILGTTSGPGATSTGGDSGGTDQDNGTFTSTAAATGSEGNETTSAIDPSLGCAVDFLFIVDNSPSMTEEHQKLIASFPAFLSSTESVDVARNHHVMVIDTDANGLEGSVSCSEGHCECEPSELCCERVCYNSPSVATCNGRACGEVGLPECRFMLGSARRTDVHTQQSCGFASGRGYLTAKDPLAQTFACAADVGSRGLVFEEVIAGLQLALDPQSSVRECNAGFHRPGAALVVVFLTDEDYDGLGQDSPNDWYEGLAAVLGPKIHETILLGFIGDGDTRSPLCQDGPSGQGDTAAPAPKFRHFIRLFGPRGIASSVCAPDYLPGFRELESRLVVACSEQGF